MLPLWLSLWPLMDNSQGLVVLFVVILLLTMLTFVLRWVFGAKQVTHYLSRRLKPGQMMESEGSCIQMPHDPQERQLQYQSCPFNLMVSDRISDKDDDQTLKTSIRCQITSRFSFWQVNLWGCSITDFHLCLQIDWAAMRTALLDGSFLQNYVADRSEPELMFGYEDGLQVTISPTEKVKNMDWGQKPRTLYPLVVILFRNEDDGDEELLEADTVALINVIHIRDSDVPLDTSVVYKYTKLLNGHTVSVAPVYPSGETVAPSLAPCVICRINVTEIVLFPCRHFCICYECFRQVHVCPICRSYIQKFHRVHEDATENGADGVPDPEEGILSDTEPIVAMSDTGLFSRVSARLNSFLGFT